MNEKKCQYCQAPFSPSKDWQKFCNGKCRDAWHKRAKDAGAQIVAERGPEPPVLRPLGRWLKEYVSISFPPCVYFLLRGDKIIYIGFSTESITRIYAHQRDKEFDRVLYLPADDSKEWEDLEYSLISVFKPQHNKKPPQCYLRSKTDVFNFLSSKYGEDVAKDVVARMEDTCWMRAQQPKRRKPGEY